MLIERIVRGLYEREPIMLEAFGDIQRRLYGQHPLQCFVLGTSKCEGAMPLKKHRQKGTYENWILVQ